MIPITYYPLEDEVSELGEGDALEIITRKAFGLNLDNGRSVLKRAKSKAEKYARKEGYDTVVVWFQHVEAGDFFASAEIRVGLYRFEL